VGMEHRGVTVEKFDGHPVDPAAVAGPSGEAEREQHLGGDGQQRSGLGADEVEPTAGEVVAGLGNPRIDVVLGITHHPKGRLPGDVGDDACVRQGVGVGSTQPGEEIGPHSFKGGHFVGAAHASEAVRLDHHQEQTG
jgi:hypothetical protein